MSMKLCKICGEWKYDFREHKCPPVFYITHEEYLGDEKKKIYAWTFEEAAKKYGEKYNSNGDYSLMNDSIDIVVSDGKTEKKFSVSAEPDIHYSVSEVE
jgi:hypothetical protein